MPDLAVRILTAVGVALLEALAVRLVQHLFTRFFSEPATA
jgi:hypothetical protein